MSLTEVIPRRLATGGRFVVAKLAQNKARLAVCLTLALACSFLAAHLLADNFAVSRVKWRPARQASQSTSASGVAASGAGAANQLDPFASRPRIQTQNGHLVIQASQDKNIDFRTSGSRGSITINGFRMDQLVGVARAFDKNRGQYLAASLANDNLSSVNSLESHYELLVKSLFESAQKMSALEREQARLSEWLESFKASAAKLSKREDRRAQQLRELKKSQESVAAKLRENNCFDLASGQPVCRNGATCIDLYDSFKCLCPDNFEGPTCEQDVDECLKFRNTDLGCQNGGRCVNSAGGYRCECPAQFHGVHCTERHDDCSMASSSAMCGHGKCVNLARTAANQPNFECICDQGWTQESRSPACIVDINECAAGQNVSGGELLAAGSYPCSQNPFVECVNLPGSFQCGPCPPGYTGNGRVCRDVDECALNNGGCSQAPPVECLNLPGTRRCGPCPPGYLGDGLTCTRVSACQAEPNGGCHPMAKCLELGGALGAGDQSRLCICEYPYVGSGVGAAGCAPVGALQPAQVLPSGALGALGALDNLNWNMSSQVSALNEMLAQLPNLTASVQAFQQDDCQPNPCLNGGQCLHADANFECVCPLAWTGKLCEELADFTCGGQFRTSQGAFEFPFGGNHEKLLQKFMSKGTAPPVPGRPAAEGTPPTAAAAAAATRSARHKCTWSISVAGNMSLQLNFTKLQAGSQTNRQVQVFSQVGGLGHAPAKVDSWPSCAEYLDVRERLEAELELAGARGRQLARLCVTRAADQSRAARAPASALVLMADTNMIDLEYAYERPAGAGLAIAPADRPALSFQLAWTKVEPACGGELPVRDSGSISSPRFPEFYPAGTECRYLVRVPPGQRIRIQFGELALLAGRPQSEQCADSLVILDGALGGTDRPVLFRHCSNQLVGRLSLEPSHSAPIVSSSSSVEVVLSSRPESSVPLMRPKQRRGFYLTYAAEPATPGCGGLYTAKSALIKSLDYERSHLSAAGPSAAAADDAALAFEFARYFDFKDNSSNYYSSGTDLSWTRSDRNTWVAAAVNSSSQQPRVGGQTQAQERPANVYRTRCEYEIRPADQARNHRIALDWLELPSEISADSMSSLSRWSRRIRCMRSRLMIFDGKPSAVASPPAAAAELPRRQADGSDSSAGLQNSELLLATFCAGDKYNASLPQLQPIASSGHVLYLIYETISQPSADDSPLVASAGDSGKRLAASRPPSPNPVAGFKLRYSTVCSAIYRQLEGQIISELDLEVDECLYHIMLPPNNTISLLIEPLIEGAAVAGEPTAASRMTLPDGSCAAQAVLMDGAVSRGRLALAQAERQLRTFDFSGATFGSRQTESSFEFGESSSAAASSSAKSARTSGATSSLDGPDDSPLVEPEAKDGLPSPTPGSPQSNGTRANSYWQYSSSQTHDIKEFDVCKLPALGIDSLWNHMSLMFKLNPKLKSAAADSSASRLGAAAKVKIAIRYQAESSCGGVISEPRNGSIKLVSALPVGSLASYPLTVSRYEQLHRQLFVNQCAWILRNSPGQQIQFDFAELPVGEIASRRRDWIAWLRNSTSKGEQQLKAARAESGAELSGEQYALARARAGWQAPLANCSQAFQELIELYEPSAGSARLICPSELLDLPANFHWTSQSDTLFVRLINDTTGSAQATFPGRKPLKGFPPVLNYRMLSGRDLKCGGRMLQSSGTIQTPRFPFNYAPSTRCIWVLEAPDAGQQLRLNFTRFQLEESTSCRFDYLEIRNGPSEQSPLIGRFCSSDLQARLLVSQSSSLYLEFKSDAHLNRPGFQLHFDAAQTGCGGVLSAASGQINSPNYPHAFAHGADCEWTIEVAASNRIELTVVDLDLSGPTSGASQRLSADDSDKGAAVGPGAGASKQAPGCQTEGLRADYLEFLDPARDTPGRSLGRFCHLSQLNGSRTMRSSSNRLHIVYRSQALDSGRGFKLTYKTECTFEQELTGFGGVVESPAFPGDPGREVLCTWVLRAPLGSNLSLALTHLNLPERSADDFGWWHEISGTGENKKPAANRTGARSCPAANDQLKVWSGQVNSSATISQRLESLNATQVGSFERWQKAELKRELVSTNVTVGIYNFTLARQLCGSLEQLAPTERHIELASNVAILNLLLRSEPRSPRAVRLEWRARGCGGRHQLQPNTDGTGVRAIDTVKFDERLNLTKWQAARPIECVWSFDLTRVGRMFEIDLRSDMRPAPAATPTAGDLAARNSDACEEASLTLYDGLTFKAPVLMQNCDLNRPRETLLATSGQLLVRYFSSGRHSSAGALGRNFALNGYPVDHDECAPSVFDLATPFLRPAGTRTSPGYPEQYEPRPYRCTSLITSADTGRLRVTIEQIDIPGESATGDDDDSKAAGLRDADACRKSGSYLLLHSAESMQLKDYFCGKFDRSADIGTAESLARTTFVLEQQAAFVEFHNRDLARGRWKLTYDRLCGSFIPHLSFARDFATPNYPARPDWPQAGGVPTSSTEKVCIWKVNSNGYPSSSGGNDGESGGGGAKPVKLHFSLIDFVESDRLNDSPSDCLRLYEGANISLRQSTYNLTELDALLEPKLKLCRRSDLKYSSLYYVSRGSELTVLITGNTIAKFRLGPYENNCGGDFALAHAEFASPDYPAPYGQDLDCHYFIFGSPGSRIQLKFAAFDLPEPKALEGGDGPVAPSKSCDSTDYVEIRQLSTRHRVQARLRSFLANRMVQRLTIDDFVSNIRANQTKKLQDSRWKARRRSIERLLELAHLFHLFEESKLSSAYYLASRVSGRNARLVVRLEDIYASSTLVGRFCGHQLPKLNPSLLQDELLVRLRTHSSRDSELGGGKNRGFLASYKLEYGGLIKVPAEDPDENSPLLSSSTGFISSPAYPDLSQLNSTLTWTFETQLGHQLEFELVSLTLGSIHGDCEDALLLYDGLKPKGGSAQLAKLCGQLSFKRLLDSSMERLWTGALEGALSPRRLPVNLAHEPRVRVALLRRLRSSSNVASLVYENFRSPGAFLIRYKSVARPTSSSSGNDSMSHEDPLEQPLESEESLESQFEPGDSAAGGAPSKSCSRIYKLALKRLNSFTVQSGERGAQNLTDSVQLTSPDWPREVEARDVECHWLISARDDTNIRLSIDPTAAMLTAAARGAERSSSLYESSSSYGHSTRYLSDQCFNSRERNFVTVYDGASELAPVLGRFCLPVPPVQLQSSGRHLFVRYVHAKPPEWGAPGGRSLSEADNPRLSEAEDELIEQEQRAVRTSLFKATAQVGHCGGQFHVLYSARIRDRPDSTASPDFDRSPSARRSTSATYENNLDCLYLVFAASPDQVLTIHNSLSELDLSPTPTNADCSVGDYIEVRDLPLAGDTLDYSAASAGGGRLLRRICAGRPLETPLESPGSALAIRFHTDAEGAAKGFDLSVSSGEPVLGCPRSSLVLTADEPYGRLMSPNWPHGFQGKRRCKYAVQAPNNRTIQLDFVKLIRPMGQTGAPRECLDAFTYLDDNEARSVRQDYRSLRDSISPTSGAQLAARVRDAPCARQRAYRPLSELVLVPDSASGGANRSSGVQLIERLSESEYRRLLDYAPAATNFTIKTISHTLLLEYAAKNLLPNEGFLAVVRVADAPAERRCGGDVYPRPGRNLIESPLFGRPMNETDAPLQCEWSLHFEGPSGASSPPASSDTLVSSAAPTTSLNFFLVFDVLELPPHVQNSSMFGPSWSSERELCASNHLLATDATYGFNALTACGYLTNSRLHRFWSLDPILYNTLILRTKNLERVVYSNEWGDAQRVGGPKGGGELKGRSVLFRGVRAYLHASECPRPEVLPGFAYRVRSHVDYSTHFNATNSMSTTAADYQPGLCRWSFNLKPGHYDISMRSINLRPAAAGEDPTLATAQNSTGCDLYSSDFDYVELRAARQSDAPVLVRFCAQNQLQVRDKTLQFELTYDLTIVFVAGIERLRAGKNEFPAHEDPKGVMVGGVPKKPFGFELELVRIKQTNVSDFCRREARFNIYQLIRNRELAERYGGDYYSDRMSHSSLYSKRAHCTVDLSIDSDLRFNLTFVSFFDLEPSRDCKSDYVEISDLIEMDDDSNVANTTATTSGPPGRSKKIISATTTRRPQSPFSTKSIPTPISTSTKDPTLSFIDRTRVDDELQFYLKPKPIGRWCGRTIPKGSFISNSSKIRLTFHSNDQIEGKGFILEWAAVVPDNSASALVQ